MITKLQWEQMTLLLKGLYNIVEFEYEGRSIKVVKSFLTETKLGYVVYIDNQLSPGMGYCDMKNFDPITEKVWRRRSKALYPIAEVKEIEKAFGKRKAKQYYPNLYNSIVWYDPVFTTAASVVNQLKRLENLTLKTNVQELAHAA